VDADGDDDGHQGKGTRKEEVGNEFVIIHGGARFPTCGNGSGEGVAKQTRMFESP
jgi:hypothetical protein